MLCITNYSISYFHYSYGPPHMAEQKQDDQHKHTFSSYVRIRDVVLKTYLGRWTIWRSGERGSGISVLPARYDDDDEMIKQFYFQQLNWACHLYCKVSNSSIWPIDRILSGTTIPGQSGPGSKGNGNEGVLCISLIFSITGASPSDFFMSYSGHSLGRGLPVYRDTVGVFFSPRRLDKWCNIVRDSRKVVVSDWVSLVDKA